jgi:mannitol-1-phosphate/altronate dehydrogenase
MKSKIIIMGSGAIGRGYLPWALDPNKHEFIFIDSNERIVSLLNSQKVFDIYRVMGQEYENRTVKVRGAYTPQNFNVLNHSDAVACFFSVGPRNVAKAAQLFCGTTIPLILCENEPDTVNLAKRTVKHEEVYFAVPDVITSNTAPENLLAEDPLAIATENGVLYIESGPQGLHGEMQFTSRDELLNKQWTAKLYLHNTPHCIAAYLGALTNKTYLHEAMGNPKANKLVEGAMEEMLQALKLQWDIPHSFLEWYAKKELSRFRCELLFDPIARVAREPLRKLELHGRLIGAAQMCLMFGVLPINILKGIVGALLFEDINDADNHIRLLHESISTEDFNRYILGLRVGEPLELMLRENMDSIVAELQDIT